MKISDAVYNELRKEGLRIASMDESGWFYKVLTDGGTVALWVTEI